MEKNAAIIGGSLAGLMSGIMLRHQGYTVTILEQDIEASKRRSQAAGITPGPDFMKFMERYDRTGQPISDGKEPTYICAKDGSIARTLPMAFNYSSWGLLNNILRANFDGHVSQACPIPPEPIAALGKSLYIPGKRVTGVQFTDGKAILNFSDVSTQNQEEVVSDSVAVADGSASNVRSLFFPECKRLYSGYVSWRGTVPETQVSTATNEYFDGCGNFFRDLPKGYMLVYKIPSDDSDLSPGGKLINWVWYQDRPEGSKELREAMTDINGKEHINTVPRDILWSEAWKKQKAIGLAHVPAPCAEMFEKTQTTFVTKINNVASPEATINDRLFFVGDALNTLRPHVAQGTNQAAFHVLMLEGVIKGHLTLKIWGQQVMRQSRMTAAISILAGMYGLRKWSALVRAVINVLTLVISLKLLRLMNTFLGRGRTKHYDLWNT